MAIVIKNLYQGQLPLAVSDLYTVPASTTAIVREIRLVNTDVSTRLVNLYYQKASVGVDRRLIPVDLSIDAGDSAQEETVITMGAGDKIRGNCDAATVVDVVISGIERT
jgi:hypothetical protein